MGAKVIIRKANSNDIQVMTALLAELFTIENDFNIDKDKQLRGLELLFQSQDSIIFVAETFERVIGMISMQSMISTVMGGYVGLIEDMIVTSEFRGQGIGKQLLTMMIEESIRLGYTRLTLGADLRNIPAISFYKTSGFEPSNMGLMYRI